MQIDCENGYTLWQDAIHLEMAKVWIAFWTLNDDESIPPTYQQICCHMVYVMKMEDFCQFLEGIFFRNKSTHFRNSIGIWNFCVFKLSFLLACCSKIPFGFIFMNTIIMCLLIITIWKPCGQHGNSFNQRLWSWLVISFPMALLLLLPLPLPLLLLASWWHTQVKENHARCCRKHTSW
jgi:hypothetical protein